MAATEAPALSLTGPDVPAANRAVAAVPDKGTGTEYVILKRVAADGDAWTVWGHATSGAGRDAAIRAGVGETEGTFKAVPVRSWSGALELSVETVKRVAAKSVDD